jgi:hypothetical protein
VKNIRCFINNEPELNQYVVLTILVGGLIALVIGGYKYLYMFPGLPNLTLPAYGLLSALIGIAIAYFFVRLRRSYDDLAM